MEGSIQEKDAQVGTSEEIHIDPTAEKKVSLCLHSPCKIGHR